MCCNQYNNNACCGRRPLYNYHNSFCCGYNRIGFMQNYQFPCDFMRNCCKCKHGCDDFRFEHNRHNEWGFGGCGEHHGGGHYRV